MILKKIGLKGLMCPHPGALFKKRISVFWCSWSYEPQWVACKVNEPRNAKFQNHQGGHIYKQTKNLHTVGVQTAERRRRLQRPIRLAIFMFFDVKFGLRHVA